MKLMTDYVNFVTGKLDKPLDLSLKEIRNSDNSAQVKNDNKKVEIIPISINSAQLEYLNNNAENLMPCPENMAFELMNPVIVPSSATPTFQQPMPNNAWQMMKSKLFPLNQLEKRHQIFNAFMEAYPSGDEYYNEATQEAGEIIDLTGVLLELNSAEENITPKTSKTERTRSGIDKSVQPSKRVKLENEALPSKCPQVKSDDGVSERVVIGTNGTSISRKDWNSINWNLSFPAITRKILVAVFDRHTLAHNTLSGKPSPAFIDCNKPEKGQLNPNMVADIVSFMTTHFPIKDRDVKCAITSKCADEAKSLRQRLSVGK